MCGFAGLLRFSGLTPDDVPAVARAAGTLAHRGPDSDGFFHDTHIALGFRRLKIIDLSSNGEQPMANEDGALRVVFNGEIYNHRELRDELLKRGHVFRSTSDTEVLLHLYEESGEGMLVRLRGMFAFAIWDARKQTLFLARDPLGVKPLYFAEFNGAFAFASEPKALFALGVPREVDSVAIDQALAYRYVPAPRSGFLNVEKLPPGNLAWAKQGEVTYRNWYHLPANEALAEFGRGNVFTRVIEEKLELFGRERLSEAVNRRMLADVSVGAWLSGGIDSGLVLAKMPQGTHSFCAGFAQPEYDERALAQLTAKRYSSPLESFETPADIMRLLPQTVWHADEPFFDSSMLPVYSLAERTKAHVSVVLSGDGGDEAFGGYDRYIGLQMLGRYKLVPGFMRAAALAFARWRHPAASRSGWDRMVRWLEKCRLMEKAGHHPYIAAMELFDAGQRAALYGARLQEELDGCDAREFLEQTFLQAGAAATTDRCETRLLQRVDYLSYLPGDVLHKVDRMSMAHGVEVRSPFLDVDVFEFALRLPDISRWAPRQTKPFLRRLARQLLPPEVTAARKRGFGVPLDDWFRGPLKSLTLDVFESSLCVADNILRKRFWEPLWNEHQAGRAQHGERLFALLALEHWYRIFLAGTAPLTRPV